jgi:hypothetical protein
VGANAGSTLGQKRTFRAAAESGGTERFGSLQINDQLKFGGFLNRKITRLFTIEDAVDVSGRASVQVNMVYAV